MNRNDLWMQSYTGRRLNLLNLNPSDIYIIDIGHQLANICRFTGACIEYYSVAQHSVLMSHQVPPHLAFEALMHDAHEYITHDLSSPLQALLGKEYAAYKQSVQTVIAEAFGFSPILHPMVQEADRRMLATEREQLMTSCKHDWELKEKPYDIKIVPRGPNAARKQFFQRFMELTDGKPSEPS